MIFRPFALFYPIKNVNLQAKQIQTIKTIIMSKEDLKVKPVKQELVNDDLKKVYGGCPHIPGVSNKKKCKSGD